MKIVTVADSKRAPQGEGGEGLKPAVLFRPTGKRTVLRPCLPRRVPGAPRRPRPLLWEPPQKHLSKTEVESSCTELDKVEELT